MATSRKLEERWAALRDEVRRQWRYLTDDDIDNVKGNIERLVDALRERHRFSRPYAEREIARWSRSLAAARRTA